MLVRKMIAFAEQKALHNDVDEAAPREARELMTAWRVGCAAAVALYGDCQRWVCLGLGF
jgi:hypothetical protein